MQIYRNSDKEGSALPEEKPSLEETRKFVPASQQPEAPDDAFREGTKEIRMSGEAVANGDGS